MSTEALKTMSVSPTLPPRDFLFVDFETLREGWNRYKLEDESILKAKFVLINVMLEKNYREAIERAKTEKVLKMGMGLQSYIVIGVEAPPKLRGNPDMGTHSVEELRSSIVKEDLDFEVVTETWNSYALASGITIKVRSTPLSVSRTNKFDSQGLPMYLVNSAADMKVLLPKK